MLFEVIVVKHNKRKSLSFIGPLKKLMMADTVARELRMFPHEELLVMFLDVVLLQDIISSSFAH